MDRVGRAIEKRRRRAEKKGASAYAKANGAGQLVRRAGCSSKLTRRRLLQEAASMPQAMSMAKAQPHRQGPFHRPQGRGA